MHSDVQAGSGALSSACTPGERALSEEEEEEEGLPSNFSTQRIHNPSTGLSATARNQVQRRGRGAR